MTQGEQFEPGRFEATAIRDRETLWKVWDILHLWDDVEWSSDEIEMVADVMLGWTGGRGILPPHHLRAHDDEVYEKGIGEE
jgi:hypothetical protein